MLRRTAVLLLVVLTAPPLPASSNDAAWRADLDYVVSELPKRHKNAFFHIAKDQFEGAAAELRSAIPDLTDAQIAARMMRLVAMIGDAHTALSGYAFRRLPLRLYSFSDGFYVTRAAGANVDLLEARVVAIDGVAIEDAAARVTPFLSHENASWLRELVPSALITPDILYAAGVSQSVDKAHFTFVTRDGITIERDLDGLDTVSDWIESPAAEALALPYRNPAAYYWYEYLPRERTLYVKYNVCRDSPTQSFLAFGQELAGVIEVNAVDRLVLDIRHNGGGNSAVLQPLISGIQTMPRFNHRDRFFVIIGRRTFSSAMLNAIQLDAQTNATFLGEPTGGKPNSYGEVLFVTLPNSQMTLQYSTKFFQMVPAGDPPSFAPDVYIEPEAGDYFAGRDAALEWIFRSTRRRSISR